MADILKDADLTNQRNQIYKSGKADKYDAAGVYTISIEGRLVYIGCATNMLERIAGHLYWIQETPEGTRRSHKYDILDEAIVEGYNVSFDVIYYAAEHDYKEDLYRDLKENEGALIRKYRPVLNFQLPHYDNYSHYSKNWRATNITLNEILS